MKNKIFAVVLASLAACAAPMGKAFAEIAQTDTQRQVDEEAAGWLTQYDVPSVAIAYIKDGLVSWTSVHGQQSPGIPATEKTLYNIASMTKPISAEIILRLASQGALSLDEPMSAYWIDPDIRDDPRHAKLTPEIALTHRTGFPNWRSSANDRLAFQFEPGARAGYSGEGYNYVARFAEKKMGRSFDALANTYVFEPIGMNDASYVQQDWFDGRVAVPQGPQGEPGEPDIRMQWSAADDVHVTIEDYAKFLVSVMNNDGISSDIANRRLRTSENMFAEGCPWGPDACPKSGGFAMGWAVFTYENETVVMQGGGDWGERTIGFFVPERNLGVVIFTNGANGSAVIKEATELLYANPDFIAFLTFQAQ